jgi:hypothetical protein
LSEYDFLSSTRAEVILLLLGVHLVALSMALAGKSISVKPKYLTKGEKTKVLFKMVPIKVPRLLLQESDTVHFKRL